MFDDVMVVVGLEVDEIEDECWVGSKMDGGGETINGWICELAVVDLCKQSKNVKICANN